MSFLLICLFQVNDTLPVGAQVKTFLTSSDVIASVIYSPFLKPLRRQLIGSGQTYIPLVPDHSIIQPSILRTNDPRDRGTLPGPTNPGNEKM
jgi:hypothetical protein